MQSTLSRLQLPVWNDTIFDDWEPFIMVFIHSDNEHCLESNAWIQLCSVTSRPKGLERMGGTEIYVIGIYVLMAVLLYVQFIWINSNFKYDFYLGKIWECKVQRPALSNMENCWLMLPLVTETQTQQDRLFWLEINGMYSAMSQRSLEKMKKCSHCHFLSHRTQPCVGGLMK